MIAGGLGCLVDEQNRDVVNFFNAFIINSKIRIFIMKKRFIMGEILICGGT